MRHLCYFDIIFGCCWTFCQLECKGLFFNWIMIAIIKLYSLPNYRSLQRCRKMHQHHFIKSTMKYFLIVFLFCAAYINVFFYNLVEVREFWIRTKLKWSIIYNLEQRESFFSYHDACQMWQCCEVWTNPYGVIKSGSSLISQGTGKIAYKLC